MVPNLASRAVVITGASDGIGRDTARLFGAEGAKVTLLACGETGLVLSVPGGMAQHRVADGGCCRYGL